MRELSSASETEGLFVSLAFTSSLLYRHFVLPPAAYFFHEQKKYAKTPVETHGFHPSFTRLNPFIDVIPYIANRKSVTSWVEMLYCPYFSERCRFSSKM